jgi:hypothetical protein
VIEIDTARQVDAVMNVGTVHDQTTETTTHAQVATETTQMGEVTGRKEVTNLPLNGRSYADLLALQPGVIPISLRCIPALTYIKSRICRMHFGPARVYG